MVVITFPLLSLLHLLENTNMAIGIQHYLIDVVKLLAYEALLAPFRTFIRPCCKDSCLVSRS